MAPYITSDGATVLARPAVLIVDDDQPTRETISFLLSDEGHTVLEATGGHEALLVMCDPPPRNLIVILDLLMRHGTGFDVLNALAHDEKLAARHRVIVCSAHKPTAEAIGPHFAALLTRLGASYLAKPFDIDALLAQVAEHERALRSSTAPWTASDTA